MKLFTIAAALTLVIIACSTKKNISTAPSPAPTTMSPFTETEMARAQNKFPGITSDQLVLGKTLYEGNCGTCHGLKKAGNYTEQEWREINPKMVVKANKYKGANLDAEAEQNILKYLVTMAKP